MQYLFVLLFSSLYVFLLDHIAFSSRSLQKALVIIVIFLLVVLYRYARHSWEEFSSKYSKLFFIFWATILVQLLIISTGGFQSPFLILLHISMIALSFIFSFSFSLFFLFASLINIFADTSSTQSFITIVTNDPSLGLLQIVALIAIIPISYIISKQYHVKDAIANVLHTQIRTTTAILESLPELIIVTDANFKILSTNDATVRTLQRSRSELLDKPFFDVVLLKDTQNRLVTAKTLFPDGVTNKQPLQMISECTLIQSSLSQKNVKLRIQMTPGVTENLRQISFVLGFTEKSDKTLPVVFDKTRAKYEALAEHIKQKIAGTGLNDLKTDIMLLEKIEADTYTLQTLKTLIEENTMSRIDLAQLCKRIVLLNQEFASTLHVQTNFTLPNFGQKDIAPLTVENYPVQPEQLTGPFFTIACNAKNLEIVIKKLFDLAVMLASTEKNPEVLLSVEREKDNTLLVTCTGTCPSLVATTTEDLFVPNYNRLGTVTNLHLGSGIEGFLIKTMCDSLGVESKITYHQKPTSTIVIQLVITEKRSQSNT